MPQKLHHQTFGKGPNIFLIHGWGFHSGVWKPLLKPLNEHFRVTVVDLPGHGKSTANFSTLLDLTQQLLDIAPQKSIWCGWSFGGLVNLQATMLAPERIEKIINISSSPTFVESENWPGISAERLKNFHRNLSSDPEKTLNDFINEQLTKNFSLENIRCNSFMLEQCLNLLIETDLRETLKNFRKPQLHIFGGRDRVLPSEVASNIQQLAPHAEIHIIKHAAHIPFLSHQEEFMSVIERKINVARMERSGTQAT